MKIGTTRDEGSHLNILMGNPRYGADNKAVAGRRNEEQEKQGKSVKIFAGGVFATAGQTAAERVAVKKDLVRKEAMQLIKEQFSKDLEVDNDLKERADKQVKLTDDITQYQEELGSLDSQFEDLMTAYHVSEGDQEYKDLELIRRSQDPSQADALTEEEKDQLENMGPLSEFQNDSLKLDELGELLTTKIRNASKEIERERQTIANVNLGLVKNTGMLDAGMSADEIMDAASKEAIGEYMKEAVDHIDEAMEEADERAEELKEQNELEEEQMEEISQKREDAQEVREEEQREIHNDQNEQVLETAAEFDDLNSSQEQINDKLKEIASDNKILMEDLKGIAINKFL